MNLKKMLTIHSIGNFKTIELVEVIGLPKHDSGRMPFNIFTIAIAQELDLPIVKDQKLTENPIQLKKEKSLKFGIFKSILSINDFIEKIALLDNGEWKNSKGANLACGNLKAIPSVFVPVHYDDRNDFSGLLKNNFFNGSHVFEWFDESKTEVQTLIDNHLALIELSEELQKIIPIEIASHSDRLGNFLVQIPCSTIDIDIQKKEQDSNNINFNLALNPNVEIDLNDFTAIFWRDERDNLIDFHKKENLVEGKNVIPFKQINGKCHYTIWDNKNNIICSGGKTSYFMESYALSINIGNPNSRIIQLPNGFEKRINVSSKVSNSNNHNKDYREWISKRIIKQERSKLQQSFKLRQFKKNERTEAIEMLHILIKRHGSNGVYLWDPFLSSDDILETLCFCPYANVPLKALTGMKSINGNNVADYESLLENSIIEPADLSLIFLKADNSQGGFHDRFLIFPKSQDSNARVWSLGTSVNSLGKSHHIIQEVEDGQIIEDVFDEMWQLSNKPENIIWQSNK